MTISWILCQLVIW